MWCMGYRGGELCNMLYNSKYQENYHHLSTLLELKLQLQGRASCLQAKNTQEPVFFFFLMSTQPGFPEVGL